MEMRRSLMAAAGLAVWALGATAAAAAGYHVIDKIRGPDGGWDYVRVDPAHNRVLLTHGTSMMAVDLASKAVTPGLAPGQRLHDAMPVNGGSEILVTNGGTDSAVFVSADGKTTVATVKTGKGPDAAGWDAKTGLAFTMNHAGGDITLIDPRKHEAVGTITVGGALEAAAVDGSGRAFVNVEDKNEIAVVDLAKKTVTAHWPLAGCDGPTGLAYDAPDKLLFAACDGATAVVDAASGKVLQTLATGKGADGVAWDPGRRTVFVPAGRDGTLSVISVKDRKATIVETVATQRGARTIAEDPRTGRVYLPSAEYAAAAQPGGRPTVVPGSFNVLVVGP
jgi:hypothetical protein